MTNVIRMYQNLKGDKSIWLIASLLSLASLLAVYSAAGSMAYKLRGGDTEYYLIQQLVFIGGGMTLIWLCYKWDYRRYSRLAPILLVISVPLLIYTLAYGVDINDARRWITIPIIDKTFQTSDLAKLALILYMARTLATKQDTIKDFKTAFWPLFVPTLIVCGLIAPANLSTAALLFATCLMMMFIGRISMKFIFFLIILGVMMITVVMMLGFLFPEAVRVETWISRVTDFMGQTDGHFQVQQAKIAIAEGGIFGVGPGNSIQRNHLPYAYADCIYAIICEEYGLIGGFAVMGLYLWLLVRCIKIVVKSPKAFGAILAMGLCLDIVINAFANISVSVQLVPATGLTLPMISMGGTSLIFTCISIGIILSVSRNVDQVLMDKMLAKKHAMDESAD